MKEQKRLEELILELQKFKNDLIFKDNELSNQDDDIVMSDINSALKSLNKIRKSNILLK